MGRYRDLNDLLSDLDHDIFDEDEENLLGDDDLALISPPKLPDSLKKPHKTKKLRQKS